MYPDFKDYNEFNHYVLSYASKADLAKLNEHLEDQIEQGSGSDIPVEDGKIPASYLPSEVVQTVDGKISADILPETVVQTVDGLIPSSLLPSYVDDVIEVAALPESGEAGKIYIVTEGEDINKQYRWTGSAFAEITSGGVVIGDVTGTAYDGGKGAALETQVSQLVSSSATKDEVTASIEEVKSLIPTDYALKSDIPTDYVPNTRTIAGKDLSADITLAAADLTDYDDLVKKEDLNAKADLEEGKVPDSQLPAYFSAADGEALEIKVAEFGEGVVGDSLQIGKEDKGLNLKTSGDIYSGAMINTAGYIPTMTPYPGEDGRYVLQLRNQDSISGVGIDGATGGNLAMLSKWDVADFGSKNFHTNLNVKEDNGHNGRVTVNDDNEIAYLSDLGGYQEKIVGVTAAVDEDASGEMKVDVAFSDGDSGKSMDLTFLNFKWPAYINFNPRTYEMKIYTAEEIYAFFGATDVISMRSVATRGGMFVLHFGIGSSSIGNMLYNIPVQYIEVQGNSDTPKITVKAWGPDSNNDKLSQYTITMNTDGTVIGDTSCNIGVEITAIQQ